MIPESKNLNDLCEMNKLEHLILKPACFKDFFLSTIDFINHSFFFRLNLFFSFSICA